MTDPLRTALEAVAAQHASKTINIVAYKCWDQAGGTDCEHDDECPTYPVTVCAYCREIREEMDDEAPVREEDEYPCPTAKIAGEALTTADATPVDDTRDSNCVKEWPECYSGGYDPRCCRFPKSCSC